MTYSLSFDEEQMIQSAQIPGYEYRRAEEKDSLELQQIAKDLYLESRYYFDTNFPRNRVRHFV